MQALIAQANGNLNPLMWIAPQATCAACALHARPLAACRKKRSDKHVFKWPALNNLRKHHEQLVSSVLHEASSLAQLPGDLSAHVEHAKAHIASFHTFDVSDLAERSRQPLKVVTLAAFLHLELDDKLDLDVPRLCAFAEAIEGLYRCAAHLASLAARQSESMRTCKPRALRPKRSKCILKHTCACRAECPYHNSTHAADVVQALVFLLCEDGLVHKFTPLELAAGLIAAVIHDVGHPGVNNQFLDAAEVRAHAPAPSRGPHDQEDKPTQGCMQLAAVCLLVLRVALCVCLYCVLLDAQHRGAFDPLSPCITGPAVPPLRPPRHRRAHERGDRRGGAATARLPFPARPQPRRRRPGRHVRPFPPAPHATPLSATCPQATRAGGACRLVHDAILGTDMARHKEVLNSLSTCFGGGAPRSHAWSAADRKVLMTALLHTADLSAPARPPALAGTWARAVCEEFFLQAEREADLGLELAAPSPQRGASTIWKSQVRSPQNSLLVVSSLSGPSLQASRRVRVGGVRAASKWRVRRWHLRTWYSYRCTRRWRRSPRALPPPCATASSRTARAGRRYRAAATRRLSSARRGTRPRRRCTSTAVRPSTSCLTSARPPADGPCRLLS